MTWKRLLAEGLVARHTTSLAEIEALRGVVARNLADASLEGLHPDTRFRLAYEAALVAGKMVIACAGYRVKGYGAHRTTIQATSIAMGREGRDIAIYLEQCRRARNVIDYVRSDVVSERDALQSLDRALGFVKDAERWILATHPMFGFGRPTRPRRRRSPHRSDDG